VSGIVSSVRGAVADIGKAVSSFVSHI